MSSGKCRVTSRDDLEEPVRKLLELRKGDVSDADTALLTHLSEEAVAQVKDGISCHRDVEGIWRKVLRESQTRPPPPEQGEPPRKEPPPSDEEGKETKSAAVAADEPPLGGRDADEVPDEAVVRHPLAFATDRSGDDGGFAGEAAGPCGDGDSTRGGRSGCGAWKQAEEEIAQRARARAQHAAPRVSAGAGLLGRTYTPRCPKCGLRFAQPPPLWECPACRVLVWQPDHEATRCAICRAGIGRWSRHHCRCCGRLICGNCCPARAWIAGLGYEYPVKVCTECANHFLSTKNTSSTNSTQNLDRGDD